MQVSGVRLSGLKMQRKGSALPALPCKACRPCGAQTISTESPCRAAHCSPYCAERVQLHTPQLCVLAMAARHWVVPDDVPLVYVDTAELLQQLR